MGVSSVFAWMILMVSAVKMWALYVPLSVFADGARRAVVLFERSTYGPLRPPH